MNTFELYKNQECLLEENGGKLYAKSAYTIDDLRRDLLIIEDGGLIQDVNVDKGIFILFIQGYQVELWLKSNEDGSEMETYIQIFKNDDPDFREVFEEEIDIDSSVQLCELFEELAYAIQSFVYNEN